MPITKDDVVGLFNDPALSQINFTVADIPVNAREFQNVCDYIKHDDITVSTGTTAGGSVYDSKTNTLETNPAVNSPLTDADRALLLHECVHAIVDIRELREQVFTNEVAAYIAQLTYMQIKSPSPNHPHAVAIPKNNPLALFVTTVLDVIDQYKLTSREGWGARINQFDIFVLSQRLHSVTQYASISLELENDGKYSGVPIRSGGLRALRAAIRNARRPPRALDLLPWPVTNRGIF